MDTQVWQSLTHGPVERVPLAVCPDQRGLHSILRRDMTSRRQMSVVRVHESDRKSMGGGDL